MRRPLALLVAAYFILVGAILWHGYLIVLILKVGYKKVKEVGATVGRMLSGIF